MTPQSEHRLDGTAEHFRDQDGNVVPRKDDRRAFLTWTLISAVGLALVIASFTWPAWLVVPGGLIALVGVSQSHEYRGYSHWFGLLVAAVAVGGGLFHLLSLAGDLGSFLGR